jgi:toxin ParE1/3/4
VKFIIIHTEARKELDAAIGYYEAQKVGLGLDLLSEVEKVILKIQQNPNYCAYLPLVTSTSIAPLLSLQ